MAIKKKRQQLQTEDDRSLVAMTRQFSTEDNRRKDLRKEMQGKAAVKFICQSER